MREGTQPDFAKLPARVGGEILTRHNCALGLWQNHIERILAEWVGELRCPSGFAQNESGVDVALPDGQSLRAKYLVGYATPTIVHFGTVLLLSAALSAPWHDIGLASILWGLLGLCGLAYAIIVARRLRVQTAYQAVFEGWLCHGLLPFAAYAMLAGSACVARAHAHEAMFGVAGAVLILLFIGIHNAWDAVTYHVFEKAETRGISVGLSVRLSAAKPMSAEHSQSDTNIPIGPIATVLGSQTTTPSHTTITA